jgi:hypothetical protein
VEIKKARKGAKVKRSRNNEKTRSAQLRRRAAPAMAMKYFPLEASVITKKCLIL